MRAGAADEGAGAEDEAVEEVGGAAAACMGVAAPAEEVGEQADPPVALQEATAAGLRLMAQEPHPDRQPGPLSPLGRSTHRAFNGPEEGVTRASSLRHGPQVPMTGWRKLPARFRSAISPSAQRQGPPIQPLPGPIRSKEADGPAKRIWRISFREVGGRSRVRRAGFRPLDRADPGWGRPRRDPLSFPVRVREERLESRLDPQGTEADWVRREALVLEQPQAPGFLSSPPTGRERG